MHQSHLMNDDEVPLEERGPGEGKPGGRLGAEVFWLEKVSAQYIIVNENLK